MVGGLVGNHVAGLNSCLDGKAMPSLSCRMNLMENGADGTWLDA